VAEFDFRAGGRAPSLRKGGTTEMLDGLTRYLASQTTP
jgi:hypothetical protein